LARNKFLRMFRHITYHLACPDDTEPGDQEQFGRLGLFLLTRQGPDKAEDIIIKPGKPGT
jgi:hypothetical protein